MLLAIDRLEAKYVYADYFIERQPGQYNFVLQGNGSNLSAGQGQLIAVARAIAHRLSTIANLDQVLVLDGGGIIKRGTHKTLMAKAGSYANLVWKMDTEEAS